MLLADTFLSQSVHRGDGETHLVELADVLSENGILLTLQ